MNYNNFPIISDTLTQLIDELHKLPGIGPKTAQRLAYFIVRQTKKDNDDLANAIFSVSNNIVYCEKCQNISDSDPCRICINPRRDHSLICVVEDPMDVMAIEKSNCFKGLYHVLHGSISPLNGIGPEQLKIKELFDRLKSDDIKELIIATNPTLQGEATALYISNNNSNRDIVMTHLARGLPVGGSLEYSDDITLSRAFQGRQQLDR
ncbi:MAG TPA: recombination protein RecR [Dehalococcoidia bacterium]|jgi:recombination protein RecR|nr:recombination protein RecR [Dehalococcoidia bacterium]|tara:strand:+ start:547 stop:1167 length:621 start_codon:yes stop_codon:yes gene_type:complete